MASFDPSAHSALRTLPERLPHLAGTSYGSGKDIYRKGSVQQRAVTPASASASIQGSGASPYRVTVGFASEAPKPGCTCPAFRRNPWCKHVVALALALLEQPETFAVMEAVTEVAQPKAPRKPRAPKAEEPTALRAAGLEAVDRLIDGLAEGGLLSMQRDKRALLANAADLVKGLKLRRLGALLTTLHQAATGKTLDEAAFARVLTELYLVRRAVGAHADGRATLDGGLAEELVGKTWLAKDLEPVSGLELVQLAYTRVLESEFRIETSYCMDLRDGALYLERQITPAGLRGPGPKPSYALRMLVSEGALYPGGPPRRLKIVASSTQPLTEQDIARVLEHSDTEVRRVRDRLLEHYALPFDLGEMPVVLRPASLATKGQEAGVVDIRGDCLRVAWPQGCTTSRALELLAPGEAFAVCGAAELTRDGLLLRIHTLISPSLRWSEGPFYGERGEG